MTFIYNNTKIVDLFNCDTGVKRVVMHENGDIIYTGIPLYFCMSALLNHEFDADMDFQPDCYCKWGYSITPLTPPNSHLKFYLSDNLDEVKSKSFDEVKDSFKRLKLVFRFARDPQWMNDGVSFEERTYKDREDKGFLYFTKESAMTFKLLYK